jgi:hypothetical protein
MDAEHVPRPRWLVVLLLAAAACGGPTAPSKTPLPVSSESASFRYHYAAGDSVDVEWQERYHAWAVGELGLQMPQKIDYHKYRSRQEMGDHTGKYDTNGFAETDKFAIHTLWPKDNHEVVHVYTARVGRPSDFFNEGMAVAFQTDPAAGNYASVFNNQEVHQACRQYMQGGTLVLPLSRVVASEDFRALSDQVLSYRQAGSFMRFLIDRHGVPKVLEFFRASGRTDSVAMIRERFLTVFGESLDAADVAWQTLLRTP